MTQYRLVKRPIGTDRYQYVIQYQTWYRLWRDMFDLRVAYGGLYKEHNAYQFTKMIPACEKLRKLREKERQRGMQKMHARTPDEVVSCD
jgi:transposase